MNFRPKTKRKPELNLIPLIDVLIVLLIFLVLTTTFSREGSMKVNLPEASGQVDQEEKGIELSVKADGHFAINGKLLPDNKMEVLKSAMREAAGEDKNPLLTISADKTAQHQYVLQAMDAAQQLGFVHVSFRHTINQ